MTYTYDPSDLTGRTVSRARFELGDVLVDDEGESWYCTNAELYNYYTASQSIRNGNNILYNDTDFDLYAVIDGQKIKIPAHGMAAKK